MDKKIIEKLLQVAVCAPSGENCQPWEFTVTGMTIRARIPQSTDNALYGWGQRASVIAHGALLENIRIAAPSFGLRTEYARILEENTGTTFTVTLQPGETRQDPLFSSIEQRTSNRKPYKKIPLTTLERRELLAGNNQISGATLRLAEQPEQIAKLATCGGINEKILFSNQKLHTFFFEHINWNKEADAKKSTGFYLKTLELPPPARLLFPLIRYWPVLKILNFIGFSKMIALGNAKLYATAPTFGSITIPNASKESYFEAGRLLQRTWLLITKQGLFLQPLTGALFLYLKLQAGETEHFSKSQIMEVAETHTTIQKTFSVPPSETIAMLFRIGHADPPSAKASRLTPHIEYLS